jgi:pyroglutamyl-peptidase
MSKDANTLKGNTDSTNETQSSNNTKFVLTGFGPFGGVEKNPSTVLVQELTSFLVQKKKDAEVCIEETIVLETSVEDVCRTIDRLFVTNEQNRIYLHLGVNYMGTGFQLEQCGYNDASFRIPDQQGYQPKDTCIVPTIELGKRFNTRLNLEYLVQSQTQSHKMIETKLSTDPGRFVCNYLYFYSLQKMQYCEKNPKVLFVHVPQFEVVSKEDQLSYLADLMEHLLKISNPVN